MADAEKTARELQEDLIELGFDKDAVGGIKTKATLIAMILALKAKSEVGNLNPPKDPKEEKATERSWQTKADRMARHLEKQEKFRVLVPLEPNEKVGVVKETLINGIRQFRHVKGAVWSKTFNGYKVIYPKGTYFNAPKQIADNIAEELDQTQQAGSHLRIDRIDPKTGRQVSEQL